MDRRPVGGGAGLEAVEVGLETRQVERGAFPCLNELVRNWAILIHVRCSAPGCVAQAVARGLCKGDYQRAARSDALPPLAPRPTLSERFWSHVDKSGSCWLWTGTLQRGGYATFRVGARSSDPKLQAHRVAYELVSGPIPVGMEIDHVKDNGCRFRHCVNPMHLEAVTTQENIRRRGGKRRDRCIRGHDLHDSANVYASPATGERRCRACHRERWRERNGVLRPRGPYRLKESRSARRVTRSMPSASP